MVYAGLKRWRAVTTIGEFKASLCVSSRYQGLSSVQTNRIAFYGTENPDLRPNSINSASPEQRAEYSVSPRPDGATTRITINLRNVKDATIIRTTFWEC